MSEILTKDAAEKWLRSLPPETAVGTPTCIADCPLAHYLRRHGYPTAVVLSEEWCENPQGFGAHEKPAWANAFTGALDSRYFERAEADQPVTAAEALAVLESLEP